MGGVCRGQGWNWTVPWAARPCCFLRPAVLGPPFMRPSGGAIAPPQAAVAPIAFQRPPQRGREARPYRLPPPPPPRRGSSSRISTAHLIPLLPAPLPAGSYKRAGRASWVLSPMGRGALRKEQAYLGCSLEGARGGGKYSGRSRAGTIGRWGKNVQGCPGGESWGARKGAAWAGGSGSARLLSPPAHAAALPPQLRRGHLLRGVLLLAGAAGRRFVGGAPARLGRVAALILAVIAHASAAGGQVLAIRAAGGRMLLHRQPPRSRRRAPLLLAVGRRLREGGRGEEGAGGRPPCQPSSGSVPAVSRAATANHARCTATAAVAQAAQARHPAPERRAPARAVADARALAAAPAAALALKRRP